MPQPLTDRQTAFCGFYVGLGANRDIANEAVVRAGYAGGAKTVSETATKLLKNPRIAVFLLISFVVGTELPFYFNLTGLFLADLGTEVKNISAVMSIGQVADGPQLDLLMGPRGVD